MRGLRHAGSSGDVSGARVVGGCRHEEPQWAPQWALVVPKGLGPEQRCSGGGLGLCADQRRPAPVRPLRQTAPQHHRPPA